jgi:hypothetical protein
MPNLELTLDLETLDTNDLPGLLSSLMRLTASYRELGAEHGFSEAACEEMAVALHGVIITRVFLGEMTAGGGGGGESARSTGGWK